MVLWLSIISTIFVKWEYQTMITPFHSDKQSIQIKGISQNIDFSFDFQDLELKE
jgi:hypothetical protein